MTVDLITFHIFAALAVVSGVLVVTTRNVIHSAIYLITSLLATAGIFLLLKAQFLFVVQIILYVGGIMVLFIFVVMLVNLDVALRQMRFNRQKWVAGLLAIALAGQFATALYFGARGFDLASAQPQRLSAQNTEEVSKVLFEKYMLPFEIASVLLLVAMIGAVVMTRRRT
jgi:NADH-quinone oxidoreductase subunit J